VRRFVGRFDVDADDVVRLESLDAVAALGGVVGIEVAGRAGNIDARPTEENADTADEIDRAQDRPFLAVDRLKRLQRRCTPLPPEPALRRRPFARGAAGLVGRMIGEQCPAARHQQIQEVGARSARQVAGDRLIGNIVGRLRLGVVRKRSVAAAVDEDVAVADAGMKFERPFEPAEADGAAEVRLECLDEFLAVVVRDVPGGEVAHLLAVDVNEIAANRPIALAERNAHRRRFERRPARVDFERVVTEQAERRHIARRRQRRRHIVGPAAHARLHDRIHVRRLGGLQRRLAAKRLERLVGAAVGDDDGVFHADVLASDDYEVTPRPFTFRAPQRTCKSEIPVQHRLHTGFCGQSLSPSFCGERET
jgi:hypothetical protein